MLSKIKRGLSVGFFGIGRSNHSLLSSLPLENCTVTLRSDGYIDPKIYPGARILTGEDATSELTEDILFFHRRLNARGLKIRAVLFSPQTTSYSSRNAESRSSP